MHKIPLLGIHQHRSRAEGLENQRHLPCTSKKVIGLTRKLGIKRQLPSSKFPLSLIWLSVVRTVRIPLVLAGTDGVCGWWLECARWGSAQPACSCERRYRTFSIFLCFASRQPTRANHQCGIIKSLSHSQAHSYSVAPIPRFTPVTYSDSITLYGLPRFHERCRYQSHEAGCALGNVSVRQSRV